MNKNKRLMLSILGVLSIVLITTGITYAFFSYTGEGTTDNIITTDTITFLYTETDGVGNGINIENTFPKSDDVGKVSTKTNEYFDFKVTSKTASTISIPYEVTARKSSDSDNIDEYIRVYLTKGVSNQQVLLDNYSELAQTKNVSIDKYTEKTIYTGEVPANESNYEETFRLRMWLSDDTSFNDGIINNKTFKLTVNVYSNAEVVSENEPLTLRQAILNKYDVIEDEPTLDKTSSEVNENGLYKSTLTNSGKPTYYFRGNVDNTVEFAEQIWKVVRINEDGTVRLIMANGINNNAGYKFNPTSNNYKYMYYSESNVENGAKYILDDWYRTNIVAKDYDTNVAVGDYYCEEARTKVDANYTSGDASMILYSDYKPTFKCSTDGNGYGIVNTNVGLITYDEVVYAGGYFAKFNSDYYLYDGGYYWLISPAGVHSTPYAYVWRISNSGHLSSHSVNTDISLRPVINLKADTPVVEGENTVWKVVE